MTVDKEVIVERIEAAMAMLGLPILGRNGKRLYGGHAFRVAGARFLSRMGIEIRVIALLGRWGSDVVLAYIQDAPLENLTKAFLDHATASSSSTPTASPNVGRQSGAKELMLQDEHHRKIQALADSHQAFEKELQDLERRVTKQESGTYAEYISSDGGRGPYHRVHPYADRPQGEWKTIGCGWRYGNSAFVRKAAVPDELDYKLICDRCLSALRATRKRRKRADGISSGSEA